MTVLVGSRHEGYGETGMAHLLEHMVFKGTPKLPRRPTRPCRTTAPSFNGTTWVDRTNYFETMPATDENLEFGIELEADRLVNSFIKREDLVTEMTVVRNEFEMGENNPESILSQRMMAVAFEWHNYGKSTIGNRTDIERVPIENLQAFYKKYYQPDNAVLIVAGKFDEAKALELIVASTSAPIPQPERKLEQTYTEEPAQDGERNGDPAPRRQGRGGRASMYHIPAAAHPDHAGAARCSTTVLGDRAVAAGCTRRWSRRRRPASVSVDADAWHDPGVLEITAHGRPTSVEPEEVRDIMLDGGRGTDGEAGHRGGGRRGPSTSSLPAARRNARPTARRIGMELSEWAAPATGGCSSSTATASRRSRPRT